MASGLNPVQYEFESRHPYKCSISSKVENIGFVYHRYWFESSMELERINIAQLVLSTKASTSASYTEDINSSFILGSSVDYYI